MSSRLRVAEDRVISPCSDVMSSLTAAFQSTFIPLFGANYCNCPMFLLVPQTRPLSTRQVVRAITRRMSDIERYHYPEGTDKAKAKLLRAREKRLERKERQKLRETPHGFGTRPGAGIFPYDNSERTARERAARFQHDYPNPDVFNLEQKALFMLTGEGKADGLLELLRARYMDRAADRENGDPVYLTADIPHLYRALVKEIWLCDESYYSDEPQPRVSDTQYDELVMHLLELERTFPDIIDTERSPSQRVGHAAAERAAKLGLDEELHDGNIDSLQSFASSVSVFTRRFPQYKHRAPMLSLDNAYGHDDLVSFFRRASLAGASVAAELKVDGVALSLEYRKGKLFAASTRGSGRIGDDVTQNVIAALLGRGVVSRIEATDVPDWVVVRGEVYISPDDFAVINQELERPLSNARNAAAGALKHKEADEAARRRVQFIAYDCLTAPLSAIELGDAVETPSNGTEKPVPPSPADALVVHHTFDTQEETLNKLAEWGFAQMPRATVCATLRDAERFAEDVEQQRAELPMEIDGIVFKWNESLLREKAGSTARAPRGAIAYKFTAQARVTEVIDVVMQVSRQGIITPVAVLNPVRIGGAVLSRATLHNFDEVQRLGIAIGDMVRIERGGDVIPKVVGVEQKSTATKRRAVEPPSHCPCCGGQVESRNDGVNASTQFICTDSRCTAQLSARVVHFAGKYAMDINGMGRQTVQKLIDAGLIVVLADLFRLTLDDILSLEGFAETRAKALLTAIKEAAESRSLERLLNGLGLPGVGQIGARALALEVGSLEGLLRIGADENGVNTLLSVPNIAQKTATALHEYLRREQSASELKTIGQLVRPRCVVDEEESSSASLEFGSVSGKSFAFTGKFVQLNRTAVIKWVKQCGGRVMNDVSRKTDFVIYGLDPGYKLFKAHRLQRCTVEESEFLSFFTIPGEVKEKLLSSRTRNQKV